MFSTTKRKFFSQLEKESLIVCVEKYKHILESKAPNSYSNAHKNSTWKRLTEEFNAIHGVGQCTCKQLQDLYKNLKRRKQYDPEKEKCYFLTFDQRKPETITGSETIFLTDTDPDMGVVLKAPSSPEDTKDFLKISACEENVNTSGLSDSSNMVQSTNTIGCIAIDSVTTPAKLAESSTTAGCSSAAAANIDLGASTTNNEELQRIEPPSVSQVKPSTSTFRTKYLNLYKMKRRLAPSPAKAADALQKESADKSRAQTEEQQDLANHKLLAELDAQLNAERRAQEQHDMMIRNLRREERKMIREEKRARREAVRAEKLHALKIRCLEAKIRYFESQLGGE